MPEKPLEFKQYVLSRLVNYDELSEEDKMRWYEIYKKYLARVTAPPSKTIALEVICVLECLIDCLL